MGKFDLKYGLDDRLPAGELLMHGLQWFVITVPTIIIVGNVVAGFHFVNFAEQVLYLQKLFFISGLVMVVQVLWGHRLPLIAGPATVLLVGIVASRGGDMAAVYTSILVGGVILFAVSAGGLYNRLAVLFTPRVVAVILLLIAFTMTPAIMKLIFPPGSPSPPLFNLGFALFLGLLMLAAGRVLTGIWKSTIIVWAFIAGSLAYLVAFSGEAGGVFKGGAPPAWFFTGFLPGLHIEPGLLFSFLVCFLALSINDLGSIQSVGTLIKPGDMTGRVRRGISITGLGNIMSGLFGVIGPVNFSLSPGIIAVTGNASRFAILPAAAALLLLSFLPGAIAFAGHIPPVVTGTVLLYVMCSQVAAGLVVAFGDGSGFGLEDGLVVGLPLLMGVIISFLPADVINTFPEALRPVAGNGFVLGVLTVLLLEHLFYRKFKNNN